MLNENQLSEETGEDRKINPIRRRRSSSVGSKRNKKRNDLLIEINRNEYLQKCASSGNLFNNTNNVADNDSLMCSTGSQKRFPTDMVPLENIFINWYTDPKSVKNDLTRLHENGIFKTGFPNLEKYNSNEYYPPVMFLISHHLKIEYEYEIYTINNYDVRLSELMGWSSNINKDLSDDYHKGFKAINQKVFDADYDPDDRNEKSNEESKPSRRHSEIMGLIIANKNQPVSYFLPNKSLNGFEVVSKVGEVTVIDPVRKSDKSTRHIILTNDMLSIYNVKRTSRLKFKFFLKHLYCEICTDHQIQNIDSSLRIGGPFGDDLILTFSDPNSRKEWNSAIQSSISAFLESFKANSIEITVLASFDTNSSAPLVKKVFPVNGKTTGLDLKKKAIEGFNQNDKNANDFDLTFNVKNNNREFVLHDDVIVMVLQEHVSSPSDSTSCNEDCQGNTTPLNRTHFYLKYNPSKDITKIKTKPKTIQDFKPAKSHTYILNDRWSDNVIPEWMMILLSDVYHQGSQVEGIFRVSGAKNKSDLLIQSICFSNDNVEMEVDIHTKANTLKKFFGAIDGSVFTLGNKEKLITLSNEIISLDDFSKNTDQINRVLNMVQNLPRNNHNLLQLFLVVIDHIAKNEAVNKMSLSNLSVCLAPSVLTEMLETNASDYNKTKILFECILSLFDKIVDESTQRKCVAMINERRVSIGSNSTGVEEMSSNVTNASVLNSNGSDTIGTAKSQPSIPPRRKKADIDNSVVYDISTPKLIPKASRNSGSEGLLADTVDSFLEKEKSNRNIAMTSDHEYVKTRVKKNGNQNRHLKDRHTVAITSENEFNTNISFDMSSKTPDKVAPSPFRRQGPVNRRHRDQSLTNLKTNDDEQKPANEALELPEEYQPKPMSNQIHHQPNDFEQKNAGQKERQSRLTSNQVNHRSSDDQVKFFNQTQESPEQLKDRQLKRMNNQVNQRRDDNQRKPFNHAEESSDQEHPKERQSRLTRNQVKLYPETKSQVRAPNPLNSSQIVSNQKRLSQDSLKLYNRRSSSSSRVPHLIKEFEKNKFISSDSKIVRPVNSENINHLKSKEIGNSPIVRNRNVFSKNQTRDNNRAVPIHPTREISFATKEPSPRRQRPSNVHRSNTMETSLKKTLETSEDKDVTII